MSTETRSAQLAALFGAVATILAVSGVADGAVTIAIVALAAGLGWRYIPRFATVVAVAALAGGVAGVGVLGLGMRVAMRIVALTDPVRTPELTLEGTAIVVIMFGGMLGVVVGIAGGLLRVGLRLSVGRTAAVVTAVVMGMFLAEADLRAEFVTLGVGPWLNIPLFTAVVFGYAVAASRISQRIAARSERPVATVRADVRA